MGVAIVALQPSVYYAEARLPYRHTLLLPLEHLMIPSRPLSSAISGMCEICSMPFIQVLRPHQVLAVSVKRSSRSVNQLQALWRSITSSQVHM